MESDLMKTGLKLFLGAAALCIVGTVPGHTADQTGTSSGGPNATPFSC
jgi:hypothetical protein